MGLITLILSISTLIGGLCFLIDWIRERSTRLPFPPGPRGIPILGNLPAFGSHPLTSLMHWKKEFGDIVGLQLGEFKAVLISDYALLKEAFNNEAFNGRPDFLPALLFTGGGGQGTLTSVGDPWDQIRRFTVKHLNALGFGKPSMEGLLMDNVDNLCHELDGFAVSGVSLDLHDKFYMPVSSNLWYILTGQLLHTESTSEHTADLQQALIELNKALWQPIGSVIWFIPSLAKCFPAWTGLTTLTKVIHSLKCLVNTQIQQHELDPDPPPDLITAFLAHISDASGQPDSHFHGVRGLSHMHSMVLNLFVTAAEAMSNTLSWAILYLTLYPDVQQKLVNEINAVIGGERSVCLSDMANMRYTQAVMQELLRITSTSPFSNFQSTTRDVEFRGYRIPKDTVVIANLYALHHDPELWDEPEEFRPERFLRSSQTKELPPTIPFSVGLRTCLGQTYAKNALFVFMVRLLQNFEFQVPDGMIREEWTAERLTCDSRVSIFRFCPTFRVMLKQRSWHDKPAKAGICNGSGDRRRG